MPEAFRGELSSVSLSGLLQLVESESLHGRLDFPRGALSLCNGLVSGAEYRALTGTQAVVEALIRARGSFVFTTGVDVPQGALGQTLGLVMESCRVMDEFERIGPLHLELADGFDRSAMDNLDLKLFARTLDGTRPTATLIAERDLPLVTTLPWLSMHLESGGLKTAGQTDLAAVDTLLEADAGAAPTENGGSNKAPAEEPTTAPNTPAPAPQRVDTDGRSFDDLIFEARFQARRRDYGSAEQSLLAALELRPGDRIAAQNLSRVRSLRALHT